MFILSCVVPLLFTIIYVGQALDTNDIIFSYAAQIIETIQPRSIAYVLKERPHLYNQCIQSNVCSENADERWKRCEEAVRIDFCRHQEIELSPRSMFTRLEEPKVYGFVLHGTYEDIILACACPTKPKLILLSDAQGFSVGQVNVMVYEPKPLTKKQQLDAYANKFTELVKDVVPTTGEHKSEGKRRQDDDGDYSSDSPDRDPASASVTKQFGTYKDKFADKIKDTVSSDSKVKAKDKSYNKSLSNDSADSGGFFNIPSPPPPPKGKLGGGKSSADTSLKKKYHAFWHRKKKTSADVGSENVGQASTAAAGSGISRITSFGDSRFGSFNSTDSGDEGYEYVSRTPSPDNVRGSSSQRSNDDDDDDDEGLADFENPFASMSLGGGQSPTTSQGTTDGSSEQKKKKKNSTGHKVRKKLGKTVRRILK